MTPVQRAILAVLLLGNGVVFFDLFHGEASRHFDARGFEQQLRQIFPEAKMLRESFPDASLLPDDYFFFHIHEPTEFAGAALLSTYVGYYPIQGLGTSSPHDPRVCYPVQGYALVGEPSSVPIAAEDGGEVAAASRLIVRSDALEDERVVYYWVQEQGKLPSSTGARPGALGEIWNRYRSGRSDLIWVRVELLQMDPSKPLNADWQQRLYKTMQSAAKAMR